MIPVPPTALMPLVSLRLAIDFSINDRRFSVATCDAVGAVIDVDTLVLVVMVDTEMSGSRCNNNRC